MWGGWYDDGDYMALMEQLRNLMQENREEALKENTELAVYVDEHAYAGGASASFCYTLRRTLGSIGLPYARYLAEDFAASCHKYKAALLLEPEETEASYKIKKFCRENHMPLRVLTAAYEQISQEELRLFAQKAGCHIYTEQAAVVYANQKYIFFHTAQDGEYTVHAPENKALYDVWNDKEFLGKIQCKKGESFLLRVEEKK